MTCQSRHRDRRRAAARAASGAVRFSRPPEPNPAGNTVSLAISVRSEQWVDLSIHDVAGRRVATLWQGTLTAGEHPFSWNGAPDDQARERGASTGSGCGPRTSRRLGHSP